MNAPLRSLLVPAFFTALVGALLIGLGIWQLHRLAWKEGIIANIEARTKAPPRSLPAPAAWAQLKPADYDYRRVAFDGTFRNDKETLVFHGSPEGPGYLVLTPLDLHGGGTVLVNRGFVPESLKGRDAHTAGDPRGEVRITGLMRPPERRNLFTPADEPSQNLFFTRDPQLIAMQNGLGKVAPFTVDAEATPNPGGWPRGGTTQLAIPNNHLSYALTWFGLALALFGVFVSFAWRRFSSEGGAAPSRQAGVPVRR